MKKFACALYYIVLILSVIGLFVGGINKNDGTIFGMVILYLSMIGGGIFFFVLDQNDSASPIGSFKLQGRLNTLSVVLMALFFLYFLFSWQGNFIVFLSDQAGKSAITGVPMLDAFLVSLPYFILFIPFVVVFSMSFPYRSTKKAFGITSDNVDHIVAHGGSFAPVADAKDVMRNRDHLFFKVSKCFVPLDRIVEIERKDVKLFGMLIEPTITVTTDKGKKISIDTKDYEVLANHLPGYEFLFVH